MDNKLDKIEIKIDKIEEQLGNVVSVLNRNTDQLTEHMRRTDLLEQKLEPVETHVNRITWAIKGILWFCGVIGTLLITLKRLGII